MKTASYDPERRVGQGFHALGMNIAVEQILKELLHVDDLATSVLLSSQFLSQKLCRSS